jgi:hypothetical protein
MEPLILDQGGPVPCAELRGYAESALQLEHSHLLGILDVQQDNRGRWRLVFEWTPTHRAGRAPLLEAAENPTAVCEILRCLAEALGYLQAIQFRGGRILDWEDRVWSAWSADGARQFGLFPPTPSHFEPVAEARPVCNRQYSAPESFGTVPTSATPAADSYSLGVLLGELLTGRLLQPGERADDSFVRGLPATVPGGLREFVAHSLAPEPSRRPELATWVAVMRKFGGRAVPSPMMPPKEVRPWVSVEPKPGFRRVLGGEHRPKRRQRSWILRRSDPAQEGPPAASEPTQPESEIPHEIRELARPRATEADADPVDCSVYAPPLTYAGDVFLLQCFFHQPEQSREAQRLALEADEEARRLGFSPLKMEVPRGARLQAQLAFPGMEIDEPVQDLVWRGRSTGVQFGVTVPEGYRPGNALGKVTVFFNGLPVGHVKFKVRVEAPNPSATRPGASPLRQAAHCYQEAFISYASGDRTEVLKRVQMLDRLHIRFFQDVLSLEPGQRWERELFRRIDQCDLFLLFWSTSARESQWVRAEVNYALGRRGEDVFAPPDIVPIILEGPPVPAPPEELRHLHFNDRLIYFMER